MIETNTMVGTGMKAVVQREELAQRLGVVARAVSTRASVQILSGVLLRAEAGRLHLAATDMELSLRSSLAAQVEGDGAGHDDGHADRPRRADRGVGAAQGRLRARILTTPRGRRPGTRP